MNGEQSLVNAVASAEKPIKPETETPIAQAGAAGDGFAEFLNLIEKDGQSPGEATEEGQVVRDNDDADAYIGLVGADDEPSLSNDGKDDEAQNSAEPSATTPTDAEANLNPPTSRRKSSELRSTLQVNNLADSVKTADSWGGKEGSLPPLPRAPRGSMPQIATTSAELLDDQEDNVSDLDEDDSSPGPTGSSPSPQIKNKIRDQRSKSLSAVDLNNDADNVANFVNFSKLLQPGSSKYYYSQANHSNRQKFEKVKSKKQLSVHSLLLDDSAHSKVSMLSGISRVSSYRGPKPLKKDGSLPKSLMKTNRAAPNGIVSTDSLPSPEGGDEPKVRRCSFSSVDIREHERVAGDNPCVSSGVPLSLGWGHYQHQSIRLVDYELNKGPSRDKIEMMVPPNVRKEMLHAGFGVSISDMNAAIREVNITKRQRRHTVATEHMEGWSEVLQSAKRKFGRFVKRTSTTKEVEKVWAQAHKSAMSEYLETHGKGSLGQSPETAGVGSINKGPKIAPENNGEEAPFLEISFRGGAGEAPTF
eukprot:CAMPEP_0172314196 /NCGR_PEP_ID=MMETSP1058-20130122/21921_1 /TAXON_ID=83371 /ORGANISM="Detonula confervacea, Strain CCMP 353" /LENGTH=529 /DNA_ID=CAMNT_0013027999 /DNA_START=360 /DNA_END=1949 /DNA_ORIENTATION=+